MLRRDPTYANDIDAYNIDAAVLLQHTSIRLRFRTIGPPLRLMTEPSFIESAWRVGGDRLSGLSGAETPDFRHRQQIKGDVFAKGSRKRSRSGSPHVREGEALVPRQREMVDGRRQSEAQPGSASVRNGLTAIQPLEHFARVGNPLAVLASHHKSVIQPMNSSAPSAR